MKQFTKINQVDDQDQDADQSESAARKTSYSICPDVLPDLFIRHAGQPQQKQAQAVELAENSKGVEGAALDGTCPSVSA